MKMKWGALVVDGRNKIGGHVASKNRGGSYLRTKVSPAQPSSTYSAAVRSRLASIASGWRGLAQSARDQWNNAVSSFKKTDIFGDYRNPSGFNLYQQLNNNLVNAGIALITTPPLPDTVDMMTSASVVVDNSSHTVVITYAPAIAADHKFLVRATPAVSPGISFVKSELRQIQVIATADVSPVDVSAAYIAKYGNPGAAGQQVFIELIPINTTTGQQGRPTLIKTVIVA
jgi:hypothetical protein